MQTKLSSIVIITSLLTCGLVLPLWLLLGIVYLIVSLFCPPPKILPRPKILPTNEHTDDWEFKLYSIEETNGQENLY